MRWRLTAHFILSVIIIVLSVLIVNAILIGVTLFVVNSHKFVNTDSQSLSHEQFTRDFEKYLHSENNQIVVNDAGIAQLKKRHGWLQILDDNGNVTQSFLTDKSLPTHYSPIQLIQNYKYPQDDVLLFISEKDTINYLIGIKDVDTHRNVFTLHTPTVQKFITQYALYILIADLIVTSIIGLFFGHFLTKPLHKLIAQIQNLKNRNFAITQSKKGIYSEVFNNLNDVTIELAAYEEERTRLERMREEWISNISHDMKTPLASIRGYAELMQDSTTLEEQQQYAKVIEKQSLHMKDLLDDLNLTMRLRHQQLPLQLENINIVSFTREVVIDVLNAPQYEHIAISFTSDSDSIYSQIDKHFMHRALLNFIYNAILHNDENVTITVHTQANDSHVTIAISDDGKGINETDLAHIFERYYRGTNTEKVAGTGLGTAIAKDIISAHGGDIAIQSKIDEGTTIYITLPLSEKL